ncbi:MAG TPA: hypothetical protein ENI05_09115 [Porticoccus sp.]|nr:hypothetical protein [Porticoccus sp.]
MVRLGFLILFSTILFSVGATADTLELTNGKTMSGTFVGREGESIRFEVDGIIMTVPAANVTNISIGAAAAAPAASAPVATPAPVPVVAAPAPAPAPTAKPTVEAGRALTIRLKETLTTGKQGPGYKFTGTLEGALVVDGITVAPMGSLIYGLVQKSKASGRVVGSAEMLLTLTDIQINGELKPIVTSALNAVAAKSTGRTSAGRLARGAAIGGLAGGKSGARTGAKIGGGLAILSGGNQVSIPSGTLLDFRLAQNFTP